MEDAWRELFVLGIAQWAIPVDSSTLLAVSGAYGGPKAALMGGGGWWWGGSMSTKIIVLDLARFVAADWSK